MRELFTPNSSYKKRARLIAVLWTLLIFIACLLPAKDIPEVNVPLADKWAHFLLFGGFAFLWLCSKAAKTPGFFVFILSVLYGWFIEAMQGAFPFLGRKYELMDIVADSIGGVIGLAIFYFMYYHFDKRKTKS